MERSIIVTSYIIQFTQFHNHIFETQTLSKSEKKGSYASNDTDDSLGYWQKFVANVYRSEKF